MLDLKDIEGEERFSIKESMTSLDDEEESEYNIIGKKETVYENSVSDDSVHTQDDNESVSSGSTN